MELRRSGWKLATDRMMVNIVIGEEDKISLVILVGSQKRIISLSSVKFMSLLISCDVSVTCKVRVVVTSLALAL